MLTTLAAIAATAAPQPFTAEWTLEPGHRIVLDVEKHQSLSGAQPKISRFRYTLDLPAQQPEESTLLIVTAEPAGGPPDLSAIGLTADDSRSVAEFILDDSMTITGLQNWEQIRDKTERFANAIHAAQIKLGKLTQEQSDRVKAATLSQFQTEAGTRAAACRDIAGYFQGYQWTLTEGEPVIVEDTLLTLLSADQLPATFTTALADDPETPRIVEFTQKIEPDTDALREMQKSIITRLQPDAEIDKLPPLVMNDNFLWEYDLDKTAITRAVFTRNFNIPGEPSSVEHTIWTWVETSPIP